MKKEQFLEDVAHEIRMLKQYATKKELSNLNLETFDPKYPKTCIYGQMTGCCDSIRAHKLMDKACIRVLDLESGIDNIMGLDIDDPRFNINGEYTGQTWSIPSFGRRAYKYLSALEGYICTKGAKIEHIIDFLQGRVEELAL